MKLLIDRRGASTLIAMLVGIVSAQATSSKQPPKSCAGSKFRPANPNGSTLQHAPQGAPTTPDLDDEVIGSRDDAKQRFAELKRTPKHLKLPRFPSC